MHLKSTTISKYLWIEKVGTEKVVMSVFSGQQSKEKLLAGCFSGEVGSCRFVLTVQNWFLGKAGVCSGCSWLC